LDGLGRDPEVRAPPAALYGRHPLSDLHRNKRCVTLNIKVAKRREILLRLDRAHARAECRVSRRPQRPLGGGVSTLCAGQDERLNRPPGAHH
jgi:hypothetical protein